MAKRVYRAVSVKKVSLATTVESLAAGPVWAGVDVAKEELVTVLRDSQRRFQGPWKARQRPLVVAMESTGTYGDALRQALTDAGLAVHRVSGKAVKDYAEIFDGVPSNHDGKDAGIIAELASLEKSRPWPSRAQAAWEGEMVFWVEWLDAQQQIKQMWLGRLEGLLARHWPEATRIVQLTSATLQRVLAHYGGPRKLGEDPQGVAQLKEWGGRFLSEKKCGALWESARSTVGVRMTKEGQKRVQRYAEECRRAEREIRLAKQALTKLAEQDAALQRQAKVVGAATACVLWVAIGAVTEYSSGGAYRKAFGLNLKERSSGKFKGELRISKRGPGLARRWLYFAALRLVQKPPVRAWYEAKKARDGDRGLKAVIGVMRKLTLALYAVGARGKEFELSRLFPGCRQGRKAKKMLSK